jgi:hypothetical protein
VAARVREGKGRKGQLTSSKGSGRMEIHYHEQGTAFPRKGFFFPYT